jgi:outer membrane protein OmpA-like peptidoglycan-associated protein
VDEERFSLEFVRGSARLEDDAKDEIHMMCLKMNMDRNRRVHIVAYSDEIGSSDRDRLGERRAQAVKNHMVVHHGIDPDLVTTEGRSAETDEYKRLAIANFAGQR